MTRSIYHQLVTDDEPHARPLLTGRVLRFVQQDRPADTKVVLQFLGSFLGGLLLLAILLFVVCGGALWFERVTAKSAAAAAVRR